MKIAFIGLGNMGGGMAANLVKAGHEVHAFDLSADALAKAAENGCATYTAVPDAVKDAEAVVTMLPNGGIVKAVYTADVIGKAPAGALFLDCSTIDLATAREVAELATAAGYEMVDAPVSGGIAAANGGTLTFMVGGPAPTFEKAKVVLEPMAKAVILAGESGAGQVAKMCNNMLLAVHMIGTCEALALAEKAGLDPQKFYEISSKSTGYCWSLNDYTPAPGVGAASPADNGYAGGFASALMLKDLRLAMGGAETAGATVPMGEHATKIYEAFVEAGNGGKDFGAIFTTL
ncbi:3-hydroxyisobutyrate dehydrogenase [Novosphingobium resinovorum]|jgi:3-hydroxyisobutyrate dehydrogenase|uniref:3-hydroxyisobutyrate dehydrogenase n=1 Tax=Novosphingobium resinovorum TaxID=158500 RepID=A0A1D8A0I1_9SPHN|nr:MULTISPECIES: 3-hydroxyisobutyrate dehydrogenase [Novosphingobium]AOR75582.1 3-hydroxyisobutyrate dehydrogenase [Novosphingobium resinovorum]MBF7010906.1 3-hydroxyisobutyrate dehydrogenase [Novosphingobium sp. HR1a]WJM28904.1 3-hydroxyisobutyrate dehydrogenase [Novosphingobium resinovorum]